MKLVIVESPTKAKTIAKFLGNGFRVESSMGHVRDLPKSTMGVDIEGGTFLPFYEIPSTKKKKVSELKKLAKEADDILFATDEDREGEAISWHLAELLQVKPAQVKRLVFHEITKGAIDRALASPRPLDIHLVNAQQARRVLDRLVGYELSPLLWKKVRYGLSAGRVQSVAVHLIVLREQERAVFHASTYHDLLATLRSGQTSFPAVLTRWQNKPIPTGKDFDTETGLLKKPEHFCLFDAVSAKNLAEKLLTTVPWTVTDIKETAYQTHPYPPFVTSTLQQEGSRKLGLSAKQTMRTAQSLYEQGYITYMRTDSVHLSDQAVTAAREAASEFGSEYVEATAKQFTTTAKLAQEAHEAIRPAGATFIHPEVVKKEVTSDEARLYELIWKRTVASQMKSAEMVRIAVTVQVGEAEYNASGKRIHFPGFLRAYVEGADDPEAELEDKEVHLPPLVLNQTVTVDELLPVPHTTQPPARYTEASLIKKLEAVGVGRPSTYATILDTIIEREYVRKEGTALVPTYTAMIVDTYLQKYFHPLVDTGFTAKMEEDLDAVAIGQKEWQPYLRQFYSEDTTFALHTEVQKATKDDTYPTIPLGDDPKTQEPIIIKSGKFGPYLQRGPGGEGNTCSIPDAIPPAELTLDQGIQLLARPSGPQVIGTDPTSGKVITYRSGRFGPYLQLGEDEEEVVKNEDTEVKPKKKPRKKTSSKKKKIIKKAKKVGLSYGPKHTPITTSIDLDHITLETALTILSLPRIIGEKDTLPIKVSVGRFGPYLSWNNDFRSIPKDKDIFLLTLDDALAILAQEKKGRGRRQATVLADLGTDPKTEKKIQILDGRYGPYLTNGTRTFASLPKDRMPESVTLSEALELLAAKKLLKKGKK